MPACRVAIFYPGQGLSLTLRDVRTLRDALVRNEGWNAAGHAYAEEHDRYYGTLHQVVDWNTRLFMEVGPATPRGLPVAAARRRLID